MKITREWAMPNKNTFDIRPIAELIQRYYYPYPTQASIDPFANKNKLATITNDLDEQYDTDYHLEATDFLDLFEPQKSVDLVFFDPPFSPRQVSECYKRLGKTVNMETTQMSYWRKLKDKIARVVRVGGVVISCGWNSSGIGKNRGFEIIEILLVPHGGARNDTIVTVGSCILARLKELRSRRGADSDFRINQLQALLEKTNEHN